MLARTDHRPARQRPPARGPGDHLRDALRNLAGPQAVFVRHTEKSWASVTFEGARHTFEIAFEGTCGIADGETFIEALAEHEFAIPGQLVADARITAVDHRLAPEPSLAISCELLLLRDA